MGRGKQAAADDDDAGAGYTAVGNSNAVVSFPRTRGEIIAATLETAPTEANTALTQAESAMAAAQAKAEAEIIAEATPQVSGWARLRNAVKKGASTALTIVGKPAGGGAGGEASDGDGEAKAHHPRGDDPLMKVGLLSQQKGAGTGLGKLGC